MAMAKTSFKLGKTSNPSMSKDDITKLIEKKVIASKVLKRYDSPKTPYERVLESKHVDPSVKRSLKEQFETLNPFQLKKGIEAKMKKIFDYLNR